MAYQLAEVNSPLQQYLMPANQKEEAIYKTIIISTGYIGPIYHHFTNATCQLEFPNLYTS